MRISFNTPIVPEKLANNNGYGYATERMLASLDRLGYDVRVNDKYADVGICFNQPHKWKFFPRQYKIGYHPWESTLLKPQWSLMMNRCDEIWTPSPLIADWYKRYARIYKPIHVYEHGVDTDVWTPQHRKTDGKFKFLHVGAEALRKGGGDTMQAFLKAFPNNKDVELNMKIISDGWKIPAVGNINIINESLSLADLIQLYHNNNVFVYPSWGEGFGLSPLQAMATGMPTITVPEWAPYARFLNPNLQISTTMVDSPWPKVHPGQVLKPDQDEIVDRMRYAYEAYDDVENSAMDMVNPIKEFYNWDRLTAEVFKALESRLSR